ncbi:MAG TPA: DNA methyltransferase, partial [Methanomicrobiales archaeon]|nr:DNA methyltransferase [Methanomicrobiales archaeon]
MVADDKNGFLKVSVDLADDPTPGDLRLVRTMNAKYKKEGPFFEICGRSLDFYLHTVNLTAFSRRLRSCIDEVRRTSDLHESAFEEIIQQVERIGSYGIKGGRRIYVDYNDERKVINRQDKVLKRGSYYYARDNDFTSESGDLPAEYKNTILCGDSEHLLKNLPNNCIDLVFTSPPYNFGLGYDAGEDGIHWESYFDKLFRVFDECIRVLKYGGRI